MADWDGKEQGPVWVSWEVEVEEEVEVVSLGEEVVVVGVVSSVEGVGVERESLQLQLALEVLHPTVHLPLFYCFRMSR